MIPPALLQALAGMQGQQQAPNPEQYYGGLGQQIDAQQPYQEPVPQGLNPFAAMGSVFSGTLADMLGAQGAQRNAQERVQQRQELPIEAKMRNEQRRADLMHQKELAHLDLKIKIADAKYNAAKKNKEDMKAMQAEADRQKFELKRDELKAGYDEASDLRSRETQKQVAEIYGRGKPETPEETQAKFDAEQEKAIQAFNAKADLIAGRQGMATKGGEQKVARRFLPDTTKMLEPGPTPAGTRALQAHAASVASSTKYPGVRDAALSRYLDTLRDPTTGEVNKASPEFVRFSKMVVSVMPDPAERTRLWAEMGLE